MDEKTKERLLRYKKRARLENATARRRGLTRKQWYFFETKDGIDAKGNGGAGGDALAISFLLPGGHKPEDTIVEIAIKPSDFPNLVALMALTDRDAALRAMAEEMRYQICGGSK
jgi:hypothetical protein